MNKLSENKRTPKILMGVLSFVFVAAVFVLVATGAVTPFGASGTSVEPGAGAHGHMHY